MKLLALYKSQKIEDLYQVSKEYFDEEMEGMEKIMLADRNQNWISKISRLSKEKPTFYAVGAGHLGGKNGVIALLRKEGYTVTPIENKTDLQVSESNAMDMQNEAARQLIRKWKPDESMVPQLVEDMIESVRKQNAEQAKQLESQKEMLAQLIGNVTLEYNADNTYLIAVPNNPQSGTWKLSDDHKQIIRKDNNGKESIHEILEISDKKLVILNSEKKKMIYVAL